MSSVQEMMKRIAKLIERRNRLMLLGLSQERDLSILGKLEKMCDDDAVSPDQLLDEIEKHVDQCEAELLS